MDETDHDGQKLPVIKPYRTFGRRVGPGLSPRQKKLVEDALPAFAAPITSPSAPYFETLPQKGFSRIVLEIGFGGGEHLFHNAVRSPDTFFFGAEPFLNGVVKLLDATIAEKVGNIAIHHGDVRDLLANEGLTDDLRRAFLIYLISHNRPMGEVLSGRVKDLATEFKEGFEGMSDEPVAIEALLDTQATLIDQLIGGMPDAHRDFLIGFEKGAPDWSIPGYPHARDLPAVLWRQKNLAKLKPERRAELVALLKQSLGHRASSKNAAS